jgi:hypothetical protein
MLSYRERDYDFLWARTDYATVARLMVERTYEGLRDGHRYWGYYPEQLFFSQVLDRESPSTEVRARQDEVLESLIRDRSHDDNFVSAMFNIIAHFSAERRVRHVKTLVDTNRSVELFKRISLEPSSMSWSGSKVPLLEERAAFWRSLRSVFGTIDLLGHRQIVDERLEHASEQIEMAKREEFMDD